MGDGRSLHQAPLDVSYGDDPRVMSEQRNAEYSGHVVPLTARENKWSLAFSVSSLMSAMAWLFYGALVANLVGTRDAVLGICLAVGAFTLINWWFARWSTAFGLDCLLISRRIFGVDGATLISLILAANVTYYAVFETSIVAVALESYWPGIGLKSWYFVVVVAMLPLMRGGTQTWMGKLNGILLPLFVVGLVVAVVATGIATDWNTDWLDAPGTIPPAARAVPTGVEHRSADWFRG